MEVEHELHAGGNETNPAPPQDATDAGPNLNNPGDSSILVGYSTMEESTPKEDDLDENANKTGNVSAHLSLYSEFTSESTESELAESTEAEAIRLSRIITTTRGIAGKIHEMLEATTESDGISEVTPTFLSESERIMTYGNEIRSRVARNPVLAERVAQLQSLTLPPSPPRSKDDSGAEGDDEEEAINDDLDEGEGDDDVFDHANITPPISQDNNDILDCNFPGNENLFVPCTCISNVSQSSGFSAEIPGEAGENDPEGTDDESITFIGNFQGKLKEIKLEPSSDESLICVKHIIHRGRPTMTGTGSYDELIKKTKANAVSNALKRSRMARASNSI